MDGTRLQWGFSMCFYLNSLIGMGDFKRVPNAFQQGRSGAGDLGVYIMMGLILVVAYLTYLVAIQLLSTTDLLEIRGDPLLGDRRVERYDNSIPGLIKGATNSQCMKRISSAIALIFIVPVMFNYSDFFANQGAQILQELVSSQFPLIISPLATTPDGTVMNIDKYCYSVSMFLFGVVMTVISSYNYSEFKWLHIVGTVSRGIFALLVLSGNVNMSATARYSENSHSYFFIVSQLPELFCVFFFHIAIPDIRKESVPEDQKKAISIAIGGFLCACLLMGYFLNGESSLDQEPRTISLDLFVLLVMLIVTVSFAHIYWRTYQGLVMNSWRSNLQVANDAHADTVKAIYRYAPWICYIVLWLSRCLFVDSIQPSTFGVFGDFAAVLSVALIFIGIPTAYGLVYRRKPWHAYLFIIFPIVAAILYYIAVIWKFAIWLSQ